jgi:hypothetical protein
MKKVYLLSLFTLFFAANALAQRNIDWSLDELVEPTEIRSGATNSTASVFAVMKLESGDSAFVGDTVIMALQINTNPPVQGAFFFLLQKDMGVGDTVHWRNQLTINARVANSGNVTFTMLSILTNGSDIADENATGLTNNQESKSIVWYNQQGWAVSVSELSDISNISIAPNPATDRVRIASNLVDAQSESVVKVFDLKGQLVAEKKFGNGGFETDLDVSSLKSGLYLVEVTSGDFKTTQRLQVAH